VNNPRERLMELIKVTDQYTDLEKDEVNIVTGALVLKRKTVKDVMTHLDDCYMLPIETVLNFETISELKDQGYSRIPVYKGERSNVVHILFARDLLFIDPDDNKPLEEVCRFYKNDVNFVYQDTILTDMFDEFKSGDKGHMALVQGWKILERHFFLVARFLGINSSLLRLGVFVCFFTLIFLMLFMKLHE
jgi:metal transporter CNNM